MKRSIVVFAMLLCLAMAAGCAARPSQDLARNYVQRTLDDVSPGVYEVVSFSELEGLAFEDNGTDMYEMRYQAFVKAVREPGLVGAVNTALIAQRLGMLQQGADLAPLLTLRQGQATNLSASMLFVKTDGGWEVVGQ